MKNRGGGVLSFLFGKRTTSAEKRQHSAEIRERRLASIPGTRQNIEKQEEKRRQSQMYQNLASPETRRRRRASLPGTAENIERVRAKAAASRRSTRRSRS